MQAATDAMWFVVLTNPGQAITTVWRMHELGVELYVPIVRTRVKTGRKNKAGQKETRVSPRPMFPGYGFLRDLNGITRSDIKAVRGAGDVLLDDKGHAVKLPHEAVMAVFRQQHQQHKEWLREIGARASAFKPGDLVKVDEGSVYTGMIGSVTKIDSKGRLEVLFNMIRHTMPGDMVVAA